MNDAGGSLLGFGILILIMILSTAFGEPLIQILAFYLDIDHPCPLSTELGLWSGVFDHDLDLDIVTGP